MPLLPDPCEIASRLQLSTDFQLRPAQLADIPALFQLEQQSFQTDQLSKRQFKWMLTRAKAALWVINDVQASEKLAAYVLVLFHRGTSLARVYSLAVHPNYRQAGLGQILMRTAEILARAQACIYLRLEVRADNHAGIRLYERLGYRYFGTYADYYADHTQALRYEKRIVALPKVKRDTPYYAQTLDFTCGPAALLMAMRALDDTTELSRAHELQLWREATTIFMTQGHGGCSPQGLALAAWQRGFQVDLWVNSEQALFLNSVRSLEKKAVIELVHTDFQEKLAQTQVHQFVGELSLQDLAHALEDGKIPLVLISSWRFSRSKSPHWVVITAMDEDFIYLHDPEIDTQAHKDGLDTQHVPVRQSQFTKMARFGQEDLRTCVLIYR
ncbi:Ribosomal protein S18 acetylase RimI [Allopseudospirillum japonicum]|uniref:Ribosomal protein S18 acetylase RimI n=1 Tax=Allopseudospirillum japonicum TaxID=64971 RepID=A0A1H6QH25_9GAMM|nr:GNAT family N-acetyltransferase/peptidase C39 family protein [Allopseudospirillum japonicum]SEI38720.1 Ribosomal protein S18 acetylase RimI [Allopseudospirillum japonicum]